MTTYTGTAANDAWTVVQASSFTLDGAGGVDTLYLGTSKLSDYSITQQSDGAIMVDSVSGASSQLHAKLYNMEKLVFNNNKTSIDLTTYFGDSSAPTLLSSTPANGATSVALNANLTLTFSEAIKLGSGSIQLQNAAGTVIEAYAAGSAALSVSGSTLTINPSADLALGSSYQLVLASGALTDSAGNAYAGGTASFASIAVNHAPSGAVSISGTAQQGQTLSALSTLADVDGLGTLSYQWLANGVTISGATSSSLTLGAAQAGTKVSLAVSYTDAGGSAEQVSSAATALVAGVVSGTAANDVLSGSAGNDQIDGGAGVDKVLYHGKQSSFSWAQTSSGYTLTDSSGAEGVDTLVNVERIQFADATLALDISGSAGQAYRLYQAAFNRAPDSAGVGYWIHVLDSGATLLQVASEFVTSAEFKSIYGSNPSNADFVNQLYQNVLHRAGDAAGVIYWNDNLDQHGATQAQVLAAFADSAENQAGVITAIGHGFDYTPYG